MAFPTSAFPLRMSSINSIKSSLKVGTFHNCGYKFDRWYDMVWMEKIIGEPHAGQPAVKSYSEVKE